jgi:hypothetical protein
VILSTLPLHVGLSSAVDSISKYTVMTTVESDESGNKLLERKGAPRRYCVGPFPDYGKNRLGINDVMAKM